MQFQFVSFCVVNIQKLPVLPHLKRSVEDWPRSRRRTLLPFSCAQLWHFCHWIKNEGINKRSFRSKKYLKLISFHKQLECLYHPQTILEPLEVNFKFTIFKVMDSKKAKRSIDILKHGSSARCLLAHKWTCCGTDQTNEPTSFFWGKTLKRLNI